VQKLKKIHLDSIVSLLQIDVGSVGRHGPARTRRPAT
jgi:hypothetical protein